MRKRRMLAWGNVRANPVQRFDRYVRVKGSHDKLVYGFCANHLAQADLHLVRGFVGERDDSAWRKQPEGTTESESSGLRRMQQNLRVGQAAQSCAPPAPR